MGCRKSSSCRLGNSIVIDAKKFATSYNAFWRSTTPTCDLFVRRLNLDGYERWDAPIESYTEASRRAFTAEFGFSKFVIHQNILNGRIPQLTEEQIKAQALATTITRLKPYVREGLDIETPFNENEWRESGELSQRLLRFFTTSGQRIVTQPQFPGCGFVDQSEGDVISDTTLYEVKTVDRLFRGIDFRQLLTYAALNYSSKSFELDSVGIFNPRRGIVSTIPLNELCEEVSGKPTSVLFSDILEAISSSGISR
jgi:hypothetical protein